MSKRILLEDDRGSLGILLVDMDTVEHIGMHSTGPDMHFTSAGQLMPITHKQGIQLVIGMHKAGLLDREHMELLVARIEVRRQQIEKERQKNEWETKRRQEQTAEALEAAMQKIGKPGHLGGALVSVSPSSMDPNVVAQWERTKALQELQNQANRRDPFNSYDLGSRAGGYGLGTISSSSASPTAPAQSEPAEQAPPSESQD